MTFGEKLKYIRVYKLHLTQEELADSIGTIQGTISALERGENKTATLDIIRKLVETHHINPYYLIFEDPGNHPPILKLDENPVKALLRTNRRYERLLEQFMKVSTDKV